MYTNIYIYIQICAYIYIYIYKYVNDDQSAHDLELAAPDEAG